jgi:uncharacterized protein YciI
MSSISNPSSEIADKYFLILMRMVPGKEMSPDVLGAHSAHLAELDRDGRLLLAGPIPELSNGLIVLRVASLTDAKAIADEDPLVRGGFQTYELATWLMSKRENGYHPDLQQERRT